VGEFQGKRVLVTGAAGALGLAVAQRFARAGASLALLVRTVGSLRDREPGLVLDHLAIEADLLAPQAVTGAVGEALAKLGGIDVLCNIAGGFRMGRAVHETPLELWREMLDVNATSVINVAAAVVPDMLGRGAGKIVNVGAMAAHSGKASMGAYIASKSAVIRLTESMAAELRDKGINVNCVLPSIIDTPANRRDMPKADHSRWVPPDAIADVILFLASPAARAVHGAAVPVVGLS
jgi:NAD(P)-dependent dehydrogenase (short-subunit alcohol dehydrogenase family)